MKIGNKEALKLSLDVGNEQLRLFTSRRQDKKFQSFMERIFARDNNTCQYCGFNSTKHMQVLNKDRNYRNNKLSNMITACPFCTQCFFLDAVGHNDFGGGALIYMPEVTQNELNALAHVVFHSIVSGDSNAGQAKNVYRTLRLRSQLIDKQLGDNMSDPSVYGQMLSDGESDKVQQFNDGLCDSMRLLPDIMGYSSQLQSWLATSLSSLRDSN